ncbi:MAG: photosynthetic complex assembly protein PuhC [Halieaceae bacterium]|jgi:putative photosynthetic complex assembly protein|nr:photosynthetic complex assembly protein PuhC [Halieaceae bacterium]
MSSSQYLPSELSQVNPPARSPAVSRRVDNRVMVTILTGLVFVVGAVSLARWQDQVITHPVPDVAPVATRQLDFIDAANGAVVVRDRVSGQQVAQFASGEGSFVRGVIRSLVRQRQLRGVASQSSFVLSQFPDGRLILEDPLSEGRIELQAFGATNAGVFLDFLRDSHQAQRDPAATAEVNNE